MASNCLIVNGKRVPLPREAIDAGCTATNYLDDAEPHFKVFPRKRKLDLFVEHETGGNTAGGTEATLLFVEEQDHTVRVNFRSKQWLDVSEIARRFGGGGHARAAGARLRGEWDAVVPRVIAEVCELLYRKRG